MANDPEQYIVIALTAALPEYTACNVLPEGSMFLAIYSSVYGPDSKQNCLAWVAENCKGCENPELVRA